MSCAFWRSEAASVARSCLYFFMTATLPASVLACAGERPAAVGAPERARLYLSQSSEQGFCSGSISVGGTDVQAVAS